MKLRIKMLREVDGKIETFYVNSVEEKQLLDTQRKKYRKLDMPINEQNKKQALQQRQKTARDLREIKMKLNELNPVID